MKKIKYKPITSLNRSITDEEDHTVLLEALNEFESSLGCSLSDYISSKEAQQNAQVKLNERRECSEEHSREEI